MLVNARLTDRRGSSLKACSLRAMRMRACIVEIAVTLTWNSHEESAESHFDA
jgi:hypothetical protein